MQLNPTTKNAKPPTIPEFFFTLWKHDFVQMHFFKVIAFNSIVSA
jgi:hypothetical protein